MSPEEADFRGSALNWVPEGEGCEATCCGALDVEELEGDGGEKGCRPFSNFFGNSPVLALVLGLVLDGQEASTHRMSALEKVS